jgi:hypothetical protein
MLLLGEIRCSQNRSRVSAGPAGLGYVNPSLTMIGGSASPGATGTTGGGIPGVPPVVSIINTGNRTSTGQIQARVPDTLPARTHVVEVRSLSTAQDSDPVVVTVTAGN